MRKLLVHMHVWCLTGDNRGQATTEYALVLLGAAVIALLVVGWATSGGGAGKIGHLFDRVIDAVTDKL
jgi:Flp pilus assembly pilin Flp